MFLLGFVHPKFQDLVLKGQQEIIQTGQPSEMLEITLVMLNGNTHDVALTSTIIDFEGEKARLAKEIDKIDADIARIDKKLANPKFVEKAPEDVVAGEKEKRDEFIARREKVEAALRRLNEAA